MPNEIPSNVFTPTITAFHNPTSGYKWHTLDVPRVTPRDSNLPGVASIKVIEHPGVYLLASMQLHEEAVNTYLSDHGITTFSPWGGDGEGRNARGTDHELLTEISGRVCYMSYTRPRPGGTSAFLDNLKSEGHGSVFEHPHYSFLLTGVSRNMTLEGNRHRPFSISQLSGRFVDAAEVGFVVDPDLMGNETHRLQWAGKCLAAFDEYEETHRRNYERHLAKWVAQRTAASGGTLSTYDKPDKATERKLVKKARERARDILPGCLETRLIYTVNARAIRFVIEKRCHADAAFEIRRVFNGVYRLLRQHDPRLFGDYTEQPLEDGTFAVSTPYGKI